MEVTTELNGGTSPTRQRFGRRSRRLIATGAAFVVLAVSGIAYASHTITPGYTPSQLNPNSTLLYGIPGPDALASNSFSSCRSGAQPGTLNLGAYINYWWGSRTTQYYNCRGTSLHGEGRALDYFVNKNISSQKAIGDAIFAFFRKTDTNGATMAPMRRFGIQEVIWNCQIYSASNTTVRTYYRCNPSDPGYSTDPSLRHEDHVHIGQNWAGANRTASAWTGYRPCSLGHTNCPI